MRSLEPRTIPVNCNTSYDCASRIQRSCAGGIRAQQMCWLAQSQNISSSRERSLRKCAFTCTSATGTLHADQCSGWTERAYRCAFKKCAHDTPGAGTLSIREPRLVLRGALISHNDSTNARTIQRFSILACLAQFFKGVHVHAAQARDFNMFTAGQTRNNPATVSGEAVHPGLVPGQ